MIVRNAVFVDGRLAYRLLEVERLPDLLDDEARRNGRTRRSAEMDEFLGDLARCSETWRLERTEGPRGPRGPSESSARETVPPVNSKTAAEMLGGITPHQVARLCRRGDLDGRRTGVGWLVDAVSIADYLERKS